MKKIGVLTGVLAKSFIQTGCDLSALINKLASQYTEQREGVTWEEFYEAAKAADQNPRSYTGFICSAEFPDKDVYLQPTTIYFSEIEEKEKNPATWEEEASIEFFKMMTVNMQAYLCYPRAGDDVYYIYDYGFKYMSNINYAGYIIEFNIDGILVDYKQGHGDDQQHIHFVWIGGPTHPTDQQA